MLEYYELNVFVTLKRNQKYMESYEGISKVMNLAMLKDDYLKELHMRKGIKYYVFDIFYPIERDQIYKKDRNYSFHIRSVDAKFILLMKDSIENTENDLFTVKKVEIKIKRQGFIDGIYTKTPAITVIDRHKCWIAEEYSLIALLDRIKCNTSRKYNEIYKKNIPCDFDFIESIEIQNKVPISIPYKDGHVFGNKMCVKIKKDDISQRLGFMLLGVGILEKNSALGCGFCTIMK